MLGDSVVRGMQKGALERDKDRSSKRLGAGQGVDRERSAKRDATTAGAPRLEKLSAHMRRRIHMRNGHGVIAGGQGLQSEEKHWQFRSNCGWAVELKGSKKYAQFGGVMKLFL